MRRRDFLALAPLVVLAAACEPMTLARRLLSTGGGGSFTPELEETVFHGALAYHDTTVNWADQELKNLPLNSEEYDTDGYHSTSTNNDRLTVPAGFAGYYLVHASAYISGTPSQDAPLAIHKNSSISVRGGQVTPYTAQPNGVGGIAQTTCIVYLAEGDYVTASLYVDNNGGGGTYPVGHASQAGLQMSLAIARLGT